MAKKKYCMAREFLYGWDYTEFDDNGNVITYSTKKEAEKELRDYINDVNEAHKNGDLSDPYSDDCKIVEFPLN